jgi:hypothetical protein
MLIVRGVEAVAEFIVSTVRLVTGTVIVAGALVLGGCAYEVAYQPSYLPSEGPSYVAEGKLLLVMGEEQRTFIYEGPPTSTTGDFTKLSVPIGAIVEEIATDVFGECFEYGVEVADSRAGHDDYVLALEGDMQEFIYSYTKIIDQGFDAERADAWIVPEVEIAFAVKGYNRAGEQVLDKVYDSGVKSGDEYLVTSRPAERINRVLHETLHGLMLQVVADVRPLLLEECKITDLTANSP